MRSIKLLIRRALARETRDGVPAIETLSEVIVNSMLKGKIDFIREYLKREWPEVHNVDVTAAVAHAKNRQAVAEQLAQLREALRDAGDDAE